MCWCDTFWRKISDLNLSLHIYPTQTCFAPVYSYLKHARPITTNLSSPLIWFCCLTWAQSGSAPLKRKPAMCEKKTSYLVYRVFALHSEHCWCGAKSPRQCCRYHRTPGAIPVERHSCVMMQMRESEWQNMEWALQHYLMHASPPATEIFTWFSDRVFRAVQQRGNGHVVLKQRGWCHS